MYSASIVFLRVRRINIELKIKNCWNCLWLVWNDRKLAVFILFQKKSKPKRTSSHCAMLVTLSVEPTQKLTSDSPFWGKRKHYSNLQIERKATYLIKLWTSKDALTKVNIIGCLSIKVSASFTSNPRKFLINLINPFSSKIIFNKILS